MCPIQNRRRLDRPTRISWWGLLAALLTLASTSHGDGRQDLEREIHRVLEQYAVSAAAVAVIDDGEVVLRVTHGMVSPGSETPVTRESPFAVGSVSKLFTSWGVMHLVETGRLDLDRPVRELLPGEVVAAGELDADHITVRRLLTHTAGLSMHSTPSVHDGHRVPDLADALSGRATDAIEPTGDGPAGVVRQVASPGSAYRYSGGGYLLLELLVERVTDRDFADVLRDDVFVPLGMSDTAFGAHGAGRHEPVVPRGLLGQEIAAVRYVGNAPATASTTLDDLTRLVRAMWSPGRGGGVLRSETLDAMFAPDPEAEGRTGLGHDLYSTDPTVLGHGGDAEGFHALVAACPETRDAVIVLTAGTAGIVLRRSVAGMWRDAVGLPGAFGPSDRAGMAIVPTYLRDGVDAAIDEYRRLRADGMPDRATSVLWLGETLIFEGPDERRDGIRFLELNAEMYPEHAYTWRILGQGREMAGDADGACGAYLRARDLGSDPAVDAALARLDCGR